MLVTAMETTAERLADTMTAIVQPAYGSADVLQTQSVDTPTAGAGDVLVRVHAASVCRGDAFLMTGKPYLLRLGYGLRRPKWRVAGQDFAGRVVAVGDGVDGLRAGDAVFGCVNGGAFAQYVSAPADRVAPMPVGLTFEQAAAIPDSGMTALQGLRDVGGLEPGHRVLINGASGGVGTFAVQIAKALGAEVTAVCSTRHVDRVRSLGADRVVDYATDDFAQTDTRYDVMLDLVGNRSLSDCKRLLTRDGAFVACAGSPGGNWLGPLVWMLGVMVRGAFASQKMTPFMMKPRREDLIALTALVEAGAVAPVIEHTFPLADAADAMRHVAAGHAQGKTVISVA